MILHVGLTYNLKGDVNGENLTEDWHAEFEEPETVERLAAALRRLGHAVTLFPYQRDIVNRLEQTKPDIVFNIAEGMHGRNRESLLPAILEFLHIPFTGSDALTLGMALDKALAKRVVGSAGVAVLPSWVVNDLSELNSLSIPFPAFVKPNTEGSSKGIRYNSRVQDATDLWERVDWVTRVYQQPALIEPFLPGREFTIGVLGNPPRALPVMEVLPGPLVSDHPAFVYSFETKKGNFEHLQCPAVISHQEEEEIQKLALAAHSALGCLDVSRVDVRLDNQGRPFFLEVNPLPGLSESSLLPLQAAAAGLSFDELVEAILRSACQRYGLASVRLERPA